MMKYRYIYLILFALLLSSCDEYLDVEPKGEVIPTKVVDFDLLLNGSFGLIYSTLDGNALWFSTDDCQPAANIDLMGDLSSPTNQNAKYYRWDQDRFVPDEQVGLWNNPYKNLYTLNLIVNNIDDATGGDAATKARVKAEARVMRAFEYFLLVNVFGKHYDATSSSTDPGVPLVLEADIEAETPSRSSVQEIYDFVLEEILTSVDDLPNVAITSKRPNKGAAYAILSRIYLYMGDYQNARSYANSALDVNQSLVDFTIQPDSWTLRDAAEDEQYMGTHMSNFANAAPFQLTVSAEIEAMFDLDSDRRVSNSIGLWTFHGYTGSLRHWHGFGIGPAIPEMYLTRAECNARLSDGTIQDVLDDLNNIRRNRIVGYTDSTGVLTKDAALRFALDERRREMLSTGLRWFDLKRLNKEPAFSKDITHVLDGVTYALEANSNKYVFPIPDIVLSFNPDMEQNP